MLGTDGQKMSKSRGNAIELGMDADTTAKLLKRAVTDADRHITYDPVLRPEVSNLVLLTALASGRRPEDVAAEIGDGGAAALKKAAIEAVNEMLAPVRARRAELVADEGYLLDVLRRGQRARQRRRRRHARRGPPGHAHGVLSRPAAQPTWACRPPRPTARPPR